MPRPAKRLVRRHTLLPAGRPTNGAGMVSAVIHRCDPLVDGRGYGGYGHAHGLNIHDNATNSLCTDIDEMSGPKNRQQRQKRRSTIDQYYRSVQCAGCGQLTNEARTGPFCSHCRSLSQLPYVMVRMLTKAREAEAQHAHILQWCAHCTGYSNWMEGSTFCICLECPILFERTKLGERRQESLALVEEWRSQSEQS